MKLKTFSVIVLIIAAAILWRFYTPLEQYFQKTPILKNIQNSQLAQQLQSDARQIFAPPPLRGPSENQGAHLTVAGVIEWTNTNRAQNGGLPALLENTKLDAAAKAKLSDMFAQQYFEHENPQGRGPADLAKTAGYDYISIGENLALGNFKDDEALVTAWMNSPGHRANILNSQFQEIGVAVGKGNYQGNQVWLAVQEFGKPASSCPSVDANLKTEIQIQQTAVDPMSAQLNQMKAQIDAQDPKTKDEYDTYNNQVRAYNDLIKIYNNKVDVLKLQTQTYNSEVRAFNTCLAG